MRIYEVVFILKPEFSEEEVDAFIEPLQQIIESSGGKVDKIDKWGKRRLAYRVERYWDGIYVLIQYSVAENQHLPKEIERRLRVADAVIKFLTVRIDEDLKRAEKLRAARDKRAERKPAPASRPAPSTPRTPSPPAPGEPESGESGGGDEETNES